MYWGRLATNNVEHGAALTVTPGWELDEDPTGEARVGDGKKWGSEVCIAVRAAVGWCGMDMWCCKYNILR